MEKFLIINPFGIGDILFTTPVIRALKENYPDSFIGYWCNERVRDLLKNDLRIDKIFALSRGDIKRIYKKNPLKGFFTLLNLLKEIKKEKFNASLDFSLDSRYGLWSKLSGIKKRIGFDYKNRGRFLTERITLKGYSARHVIEYYADLLRFINIELCDKALELIVSKENRARAKERLAELGVAPSSLVLGIAMGGGASWGRDAAYKQWPAKNFARLAGKLIKDLGASVVLLGSADEKPLAEVMLKASICHCEEPPKGATKQSKRDCLPAGRQASLPKFTLSEVEGVARNDGGCVIDLTGRLGLEELAAIIKELKLLVCNDGGPLHMAVALGVKTVSIFGPVDDRVYGPYPPSSDHVVIKKDLPCRPCYENFRFKGCFNEKKCLEDVTADEVYEKVKTLL
ncbi:MAG: hypothetical protein A3G36_03740 [Omnitrophica bacterium RIFCSPLOWO2_12_FULL_45_13]|nr:MAG: hypothetical protein A3G36_03740 [Omnitrophica bacterium RIFCSPLOWO2_12_FULL_45_13]